MLIPLWLVGTTALGQAPPWRLLVWGRGECTISALAASADGNLYLAGSFENRVRLGNGRMSTTAGHGDVFIGKWHVARRRFIWLQPFNGDDYKSIYHLAVRGTTLYVSGGFYGLRARIIDTTLTSTGNQSAKTDLFVLKLEDEGRSVRRGWLTQIGGAESVLIGGMVSQGAELFVAATVRGENLRIGPTELRRPAGQVAFVARLTDSGPAATVRWVHHLDGDAHIYALALQGRSVYLGGGFDGRLGLGPRQRASQANDLLPGNSDAFVAKLTDCDSAAVAGWAYRGRGPRFDRASVLAAQDSTLYVAASFPYMPADSAAVFDNTPLPRVAPSEYFLLKLTDQGPRAVLGWSQPLGGTGTGLDDVDALLVRGPEVVVLGAFGSDTAYFGHLRLLRTGVGTYINSNPFVARLTDRGRAGHFEWAVRGGRAGKRTYPTGIVRLGDAWYVAGAEVRFKKGQEWGYSKAFLARLPAPPPRRAPAPPAGPER